MTNAWAALRASRWRALSWAVPVVIAVFAVGVFVAIWLRQQPAIQDFMRTYPGQSALPAGAPVGFPAWLEWQHVINSLFIILIIRTGWEVRTTARPPAFWTRKNSGPIRTKGSPKKISIILWLHLSLDFLWFVNGLVFYVLIFVTDQWTRIVPTRWDVFPNAITVGIKYLSLNWPTEDGWSNYNALQLISYFLVVFVAAPLAIITGLRMSPAWPQRARISEVYKVELARAIHFPVMIFFVLFVIAHVTLVLATGALRNLNHMYGGQDDVNWVGFSLFAVSLVVMVGAFIFLKPMLLRPLAAAMGAVTRQ